MKFLKKAVLEANILEMLNLTGVKHWDTRALLRIIDKKVLAAIYENLKNVPEKQRVPCFVKMLKKLPSYSWGKSINSFSELVKEFAAIADSVSNEHNNDEEEDIIIPLRYSTAYAFLDFESLTWEKKLRILCGISIHSKTKNLERKIISLSNEEKMDLIKRLKLFDESIDALMYLYETLGLSEPKISRNENDAHEMNLSETNGDDIRGCQCFTCRNKNNKDALVGYYTGAYDAYKEAIGLIREQVHDKKAAGCPEILAIICKLEFEKQSSGILLEEVETEKKGNSDVKGFYD